MKFLALTAATASLFAISLATSSGEALAASSSIQDLDPVQQAQVARQRIKQRGPNRLQALGNGGGGDSDDCGSVNIGNQQDNSARGRVNPRNQTVIVTGNIFNTANCR